MAAAVQLPGFAFRPYMEAVHGDVLSTIERDFTVVERFDGTLGNGTIFICRSDAPPAASLSSHRERASSNEQGRSGHAP